MNLRATVPYLLALIAMLITAIAMDRMRRAGFTHAELKTVGAALVAVGVVVFFCVVRNAGAVKKR